jgi:hypothetical protein
MGNGRGTGPYAIGVRLVLLVAVSGALGCEARALMRGDPAAATPGTPTAGTDAMAPVGVDAGAPSGTDPALVQEMMRRWNATVDSGTWAIDFHWSQVDEFPHPTFKGGTAEAYGQFAAVLLAFFQRADDFDFLAQNHLFTMQLRDDTASGVGDLVTSFAELADYFSSTSAFGDIPPDVRSGLAQVAQQIHAAG